MRRTAWVLVLLAVAAFPAAAPGLSILYRGELDRVNRRVKGRVLDFTHNHGADCRLFSPALGQRRDLYVYLPPGFDPGKRYPLILWLHGFAQDEVSFLTSAVERLDEAIVEGRLPPVIIAAPDGSLKGYACIGSAGTFYLNSRAGNFEDYLMRDVWDFVHQTFPVRPEPEAHALAGVSMGGGAAFNLGIKYRDRVKIALGIFPPLNTRYLDCRGRYFADFDPDCTALRTDFSRGLDVVGRFYGVYTIRLRRVIDPLYDRSGPNIVEEVSRENPIEMLDRYDLREGELSLYVAYGGKDQFNIDAQVESFLYAARRRGLTVTSEFDPRGRHNLFTALRLTPGALDWLAPQLAPYSPR